MPFIGWAPEGWGGLRGMEPGFSALSQGIAARFSPEARASRGWLSNPYNFFNPMTGEWGAGAPRRMRNAFDPYFDPNNPFSWLMVPKERDWPPGGPWAMWEGGGAVPWTADQVFQYYLQQQQREPEKKQEGGIITEKRTPGSLRELSSLMELERQLQGPDRKLVAAEPGEYVLSKEAVQAIGPENLEFLNRIPQMQGGGRIDFPLMPVPPPTGQAGGLFDYFFSAPQTKEETQETERIKKIQKEQTRPQATAEGLKAERDELFRIYQKLVDSGMRPGTPMREWSKWKNQLSEGEWSLIQRYAQRQIASEIAGGVGPGAPRAGTVTEMEGGLEQITPPEEYPPMVFGARTPAELAGPQSVPGAVPGAPGATPSPQAPPPTPQQLNIPISGPYAGPNVNWQALGQMDPTSAMMAMQQYASRQMPQWDPFAGLTRPYERMPQSVELMGKLQEQYANMQGAVKRSLDIDTYMEKHRADIDLSDAQTRRLLQDAQLMEGKLKALTSGGAVLSPSDRKKVIDGMRDLTENYLKLASNSSKIDVWREYWYNYLVWKFLVDPTSYNRPVEQLMAGAVRMKGTNKIAITEQDVHDAWVAARAMEGSGLPMSQMTFMQLFQGGGEEPEGEE